MLIGLDAELDLLVGDTVSDPTLILHGDRGSNDFLVSAGCRASARPVSFLSMVRHGSKSDQVDPGCEHDHSER